MAKNLLGNVVKQLKHERARLESELRAITSALSAFGRTYLDRTKPAPAKKRKISAAGRARIAAAQRARWAKQKAAKKTGQSNRKSSMTGLEQTGGAKAAVKKASRKKISRDATTSPQP